MFFRKLFLPIFPPVLVAEFVGTFILVFFGTGAIIVNQLTQGALTHLGISLVFGAVVTAVICSLSHISGAHINPAVTIASWWHGQLAGRWVLPYVGAQLLGAALASGCLRLGFGVVANLGATLPLDGNWQLAVGLELVLTFVLMLVILGSAGSGFGAIAVGLTVGLEAACMGPITGASMNPARSFAPALVSGIWQDHWLYWLAPIGGALLAVPIFRYLTYPTHSLREK